MDIVTRPEDGRRALFIGFIAGLPADADILIRSATDPLLTLDFHRQFSHSLIFIPFGALLVTVVLNLLLKNRMQFRHIFRYSLAGYATSGLLDACTSYGTQLLWPFSSERIAWSIISVFDPIFSLTLLVCLIFAWRGKSTFHARLGWMFVMVYLVFGLSQQSRAAEVVEELAKARGEVVERLVVKPTMGNLMVWRTVYQSAGRFQITAVRVSPFRVHPAPNLH